MDRSLAEINERVSIGILLREDSVHLLEKVARLEVLLAEARGENRFPTGSLVTVEQDQG